MDRTRREIRSEVEGRKENKSHVHFAEVLQTSHPG